MGIISGKWVLGVVTSAILTMIVIVALKKTNVPVLSNLAQEA